MRGALAHALALQRDGAPRGLVLPPASAAEAAWVEGVALHQAGHLLDLVAALHDGPPPRAPAAPLAPPPSSGLDLLDVRGQASAKRALEVAAAGGHHLLLVGPPGTGKSMLAQRLPGLLPPLPLADALESAALQSLVGHVAPEHLTRRPFRSPHHSASAVALVGGASPPRPGEISLAHRGILFLDELPEFPRNALEALREPLETGRVHIARAARSSEFPAKFQLVAAMNPCPCGHLGNPQRPCRCSPDQVSRYQARLSGPLLDRIDLLVEVPLIPPAELADSASGESSPQVAARVAQARTRAHERQGCANADLAAGQLQEAAALEPAASHLLQQAASRLAWSARAQHRVQRVARTLADLAGTATVGPAQVAEAIQLRRALPGA